MLSQFDNIYDIVFTIPDYLYYKNCAINGIKYTYG
jgi:hypothetical protein